MTTSSATLASLWVEGSPSKVILTAKSVEIKEDFERYYREVDGLGPLAKQAGIIDTNGELTTVLTTVNPANVAGTSSGQYIYISSPAKPLLPKSIEPMVLNTSAASQRLTTLHGSPSLGRKRSSESPISLDSSLDGKRGRKSEKGGKGLRHFSMKVCEKVQRKGVTTYNEVADELVSEFTDMRNSQTEQAQYDQKNIRRRVYDALNVLMAMNIISKEKKEIRWIGLPTNSAQECQNLEMERLRRKERIDHKKQQLQELVLQQIAYKNLVQRNKQREQELGAPHLNSSIQLPFIIVNTSKKTVIDCSISNDKYEYLFNFDNTFEIHDDIEVLKRMGMAFDLEKGQCTSDNLQKAIQMLPKSLESYVRDLAKHGSQAANGVAAINGSTSQHKAGGSARDLFSEDSNHSGDSSSPFVDIQQL